MNAVVVDTDVVSLIFKGNSRAEKYLAVLSGPDLLVLFMTEAELERRILQAEWGAERIGGSGDLFKRLHGAPGNRPTTEQLDN
jgi:predicted nucleic acid-binding protein